MVKDSKNNGLDKKLGDLFGDTDEKVRCSLYLKTSVHSKVVEASEKSGKSINQVVERILEKFFEG